LRLNQDVIIAPSIGRKQKFVFTETRLDITLTYQLDLTGINSHAPGHLVVLGGRHHKR
jgi:hypothetical protein